MVAFLMLPVWFFLMAAILWPINDKEVSSEQKITATVVTVMMAIISQVITI